MTAAAKIATNPNSLLAVAKISTLLLNLINILLIRRWFSRWSGELLANLVAGSVGTGSCSTRPSTAWRRPLS